LGNLFRPEEITETSNPCVKLAETKGGNQKAEKRRTNERIGE
jgi:hypothetical protein